MTTTTASITSTTMGMLTFIKEMKTVSTSTAPATALPRTKASAMTTATITAAITIAIEASMTIMKIVLM